MIGLVNHNGSHFSFGAEGTASSFPDAEAVVVTPIRVDDTFGGTGLRDRSFTAHAEFSWRSHMVSTSTGHGAKKLMYKRFIQTIRFDRDDLLGRVPRPGDVVTRAFDGVTFEIGAIYSQGRAILCDIVEKKPHARS